MNIKRENNLKSNSVYDITKFSHLEYPNHLSCIVWFSGCNMKCDYCYNVDIVYAKNGVKSQYDVLEFLKTRIGLLDAVVLSGGEATTHELVAFCKEIKQLGFKIKLDTNGTNPQIIQKLVSLNLLDYIALDYKAPESKFIQITKSKKFDAFIQTLEYLLANNFDFEVRTTLHADLLNEDDINEIIKDLVSKGYTNTYYIQEFVDTQNNIGNLKSPISKFDKHKILKKLNIVYR